jgi:hypothetical protein
MVFTFLANSAFASMLVECNAEIEILKTHPDGLRDIKVLSYKMNPGSHRDCHELKSKSIEKIKLKRKMRKRLLEGSKVKVLFRHINSLGPEGKVYSGTTWEEI